MSNHSVIVLMLLFADATPIARVSAGGLKVSFDGWLESRRNRTSPDTDYTARGSCRDTIRGGCALVVDGVEVTSFARLFSKMNVT